MTFTRNGLAGSWPPHRNSVADLCLFFFRLDAWLAVQFFVIPLSHAFVALVSPAGRTDHLAVSGGRDPGGLSSLWRGFGMAFVCEMRLDLSPVVGMLCRFAQGMVHKTRLGSGVLESPYPVCGLLCSWHET